MPFSRGSVRSSPRGGFAERLTAWSQSLGRCWAADSIRRTSCCRRRASFFGRRYWQMRDLGPNTSDGQNDPRTHFGLGDATAVETSRVE
jgi:hypothetical protein